MASKIIQSADVLQSLAFDEVVARAIRVGRCKLASVVEKSWQADMIRHASGVVSVETPAALRTAMIGSAVFIFVPMQAMLDDSSISRIISESVSQKTIIVEKPEA